MDKTAMTTVNHKRSAPKQPKTKKKQPLKVVYITNPIKFKASASQFRALVQELTGQDADMSESSAWFSPNGSTSTVTPTGDVTEIKPGQELHDVHEPDEIEEVGPHMMSSGVEQSGSDPSGFGSSYEDVFYGQETMEDGFGSGYKYACKSL